MSETELMPCPFCGGEALERGDPNARLARWVNCKTCNADMVGKTLDEAIAKWNRRSPVAEGGGWRTITDADVGKTMLVTNNIKARDAFGEMSHKWITWIQAASDPDTTGKYVGYDCGDRLIHNLTHCAPIPAPSQEGASDTGEGSEPPPNPR